MSEKNRQIILAYNRLHKTRKKGKDAHAAATKAAVSAATINKVLGGK